MTFGNLCKIFFSVNAVRQLERRDWISATRWQLVAVWEGFKILKGNQTMLMHGGLNHLTRLFSGAKVGGNARMLGMLDFQT